MSPQESALEEEAQSSAPVQVDDEHYGHVLWSLAWPTVAVNLLWTLNSLLDSYFVGHLPREALTAISACMPVQFLFFSLAPAMGTAATAIVARAYGAKQVEEFMAATRQSMTLTLIIGFLVAAIGALISPLLAWILIPKHDPVATKEMLGFLGVYLTCLPATYLIQTLGGCLRGIGDSRSPMIISGVQVLLHMFLNFLLIGPPKHLWGMTIPGANMGLIGAATAMTVSMWLSAVAYIYWTSRTPLGETWRMRLPQFDWAKRILRIGIPASVASLLRVVSYFGFTVVLSHLPSGEKALAAMRPGFGIESMAIMPMFGLQLAAAALVGQSLGMKKPDRAEKLGWLAGHHAAIVTAVTAIFIFIFAEPLAFQMVGGKADILGIVVNYLRIAMTTEIFFAYGMVLIGGMQGAGDTVRPMIITVISMILLRVPLAIILAYPSFCGLGANGCWIAMAASQFVQGALAVMIWRKGSWKLQKV